MHSIQAVRPVPVQWLLTIVTGAPGRALTTVAKYDCTAVRVPVLLVVEFSFEVVAAVAENTNGVVLTGRAMLKKTVLKLPFLMIVPRLQFSLVPAWVQFALLAPRVPST